MEQPYNQRQPKFDFGGKPTVGDTLARIRAEARDESEKGLWFEQLFTRVALQEPEFELTQIHRWADWPDRHELTGLDGRDIGVDLVAERADDTRIAVQCKCYDDNHRIGKRDIDSFLAASQTGAGPPARVLPPMGGGDMPVGAARTAADRQPPARGLPDRLPGVPGPPHRGGRRRPPGAAAVATAA